MKLLVKLPLVALLTFFSFSCTTDSLDDKADAIELKLVTPETKPIEVQILELINNHRLSVGLNPLTDMTIVKSVALSHTDYMVDNNEVSHANFYKRSDYLKAKAAAKRVTENVAFGYSSAQSVVNAWLKSEEHRANIEGDFTNFDVAAEQNAEGKWFYTNIFIKK
ncbi:CAP domain-containing protein [Mariniflexile maritimum]|uniref:CAP domain-containing protein n=1 Tax=Mariniflexile maritimum TaxID=2682493 RepID=UPI0012F68B39|nr:CAP domain-containing protein [Mariniflexile maritimum]MCB0449190.1 CAP domain-containing protein [Confluentibacter sp.]HMQ45701.1 CAP domain-containing protein [Mariniflexile sp.]HMR16238.1 CAP domain-containing protein [Mariniflexile sp.]